MATPTPASTTLVTTTSTTKTAPKKQPRVSTAGSKQTQQFSALSKRYKALSMPDKSSWVLLVASVNASANRTGRNKLSAANLYSKTNTVRLACSLPLLSTAPSSLPPVPALPDSLTVRASQNGGFTCAVVASAPYAGPVQIQAAPVAPAGFNSYNPKAFRILGMLPALVQGQNSIAAMFAAKYGPAPFGAEIALKLVPMSPIGDKLPGRIVTGVVLSMAGEDEQDGEDTSLLRAA